MTYRSLVTTAFAMCAVTTIWTAPATAAELPALGAKSDGVSVSGVSSGAYMAGQFQIAHSKMVAGAAIIAGGPYGCAVSAYSWIMPGANALRAINYCMNDAMRAWGDPNPEKLARKIANLARDDDIDSMDGLKADRVYLFAGREDTTVKPSIVGAAYQMYRALGLPEDRLKLVLEYAAGHAFVTETAGGACALSEKPYVVDCDYDQAGDLLRFIHGDLRPRSAAASGAFDAFDQRPFLRDLRSPAMSEEGVVYVPRSCRDGAGCVVHVAFHGCQQSRDEVGDAFIKETGYAPWADTNRMIVLFPQAGKSFSNPKGCWDWWGYTGSNFLTRKAPQIEAVRRMLVRLAESPRAAQ